MRQMADFIRGIAWAFDQHRRRLKLIQVFQQMLRAARRQVPHSENMYPGFSSRFHSFISLQAW
ncbi:hypothetical protein D3C81_2112490 [compost metagenome]